MNEAGRNGGPRGLLCKRFVTPDIESDLQTSKYKRSRFDREVCERNSSRMALDSRNTMLWHLELQFRESIPGPLVIGDGRFCGLGLLEPVANRTDVLAFNLGGKHRVAPDDRIVIIPSLRRALMSLARDGAGQVGRLFSGHESDGRPDSSGHHAHVFLAADGGAEDGESITRLIVASPWAVDRRSRRRRGDQRLFEEVTGQLRGVESGASGSIRPSDG